MRRRYRTAGYWDEYEPSYSDPATMDVISFDPPTPRWTGLYDASGEKIMFVDEPNQIGFVWFK